MENQIEELIKRRVELSNELVKHIEVETSASTIKEEIQRIEELIKALKSQSN